MSSDEDSRITEEKSTKEPSMEDLRKRIAELEARNKALEDVKTAEKLSMIRSNEGEPSGLNVEICNDGKMGKIQYGAKEIWGDEFIAIDDGGVDEILKEMKEEKLELVKNDKLDEDELLKYVQTCIKHRIKHRTKDASELFVKKVVHFAEQMLDPDTDVGEMCLQQMFYPAISWIFRCFDDGKYHRYLADEELESPYSVTYHFRGDTKKNKGKLSSKPDGGLRLIKRFLAVGLMELKKGDDMSNSLEDIAKSILALCMTAIWMRTVAKIEKQIKLPFVIGNAIDVHLYMILLDEDQSSKTGRKSQIKGASEAETKKDINLSVKKLISEEIHQGTSAEFLSVLAYLLGQATKQLKDKDQEKQKLIVEKKLNLTNVASIKRKRNETTSNEIGGSDKKSKSSKQTSSNAAEMKVQEAAAQDGKIYNLQYPFVRYFHFFAGDNLKEEREAAEYKYYQQTSPFYFKGQTKAALPLASEKVATRNVFCKVWRSGDRDTDEQEIKAEIDMLKLASAKGVPCPDLIQDLTNLNLSCPSSSGGVGVGVYHVMTMSFMKNDEILPADILPFAKSLIRGCKKLHEEAEILHCDIKPANVCWDRSAGVVSLLDFGHAQLEAGARWYRGTPGFEAPEIGEWEQPTPHTFASDTYSVGKTVLKVIGDCINGGSDGDSTTHVDEGDLSREVEVEVETVRVVAEKLCKEDASERMSLSEAWTKLDEYSSPCISSASRKRLCVSHKQAPSS